MSYNKQEVQEKVDDLFEKYCINRRYPIPLIEIANKLGYRVCYFNVNNENRDVSGAVNYETKVILVNPNDNPKRQSFTIGHEIGHIVLDHDQGKGNRIDYRKNINKPNNSKEKEANMFAAMDVL